MKKTKKAFNYWLEDYPVDRPSKIALSEKRMM